MVNIKNLNEYGIPIKNKTFVIAEIGINHNGNIRNAIKLIDSALKTGCDAVKFQTYITEKRTSKSNHELFQLLKSCELGFKDFEFLKNYCDEKGIIFFSTPFDIESLDFLNSINIDLIKISSFDLTNFNFIQKIIESKKTLILSTGLSNFEEVKQTYNYLSDQKVNFALLHCISSYPTEEEDANLLSLKVMQTSFSNSIIGQSDHTQGIKVPIYAVALGAQIIEKHYKIDNNMECVDSIVSITEDQMVNLVNEIRLLEKIKGDEKIFVSKAEKSTLIHKRNTI